ncbi:MAG: efflux RND transporter permease subunit [Rhodospirillaceae bacterium]|nr:efflux RND transporter permease subunit [Rhodospirillaceae bacterium]
MRVDGTLITPERIRAVLLRSERDTSGDRTARLTVGDVAHVDFGHKRPTMVLRSLGDPAISLSLLAETGTNVMTTMDRVRNTINEMNATILPRQGLHLRLVYDQTDYVKNAINLVVQNIYIGGALAALILFIFLRSVPATLVVSLAIPISVIGTFVGMNILGRSLNVISLAGLAFAVGMVVDAAIVVLENIFRHREDGLSRAQAAETGARQVCGAVLVSSLTTIVVFIPLLMMKQETGQLFRDIAVAIAVSVGLSMVVAITVIPVLARRLLGPVNSMRKPLSLPFLDAFGTAFSDRLNRRITHITASRKASGLTILIITTASIAVSVLLMPKLEYLPEGNRNMAFGSVRPPPGYNLKTTMSVAERIETAVRPLWARDTGRESPPGTPPKIESFSFNAFESGYIEVMATAVDPSRVAELIPVMRAPIFDEPGTYGFMSQPSLFSRRSGSARAISVEVSGDDLESIAAVARRLAATIESVFPRRAGFQLQPRPGLELGAPEVRLFPDPVRLRDAGVSAKDFAHAIDVFNDGMRVVEVNVGNQRIDLTLKGPDNAQEATQDIAKLPVVTPSGTVVQAKSLADIEVTEGPTEIRHIEGRRTITLQIRPPTSVALQTTIERLKAEVIDPIAQDHLPEGIRITISGVASKLADTWSEMTWQLGISAVVVYLIMAALFESVLYPLIIMATLPMASAGALACLGVLNLFVYTPLDMLTVLGFVILIGIVVNNAILLVHQSLFLARKRNLPMAEAVAIATRTRIRPIFMSTLTSLFGMAPLVLFPGAGSELYRGLGAVVLGGLTLSTFLTLLVIPALMCLVEPLSLKKHTGKAA